MNGMRLIVAALVVTLGGLIGTVSSAVPAKILSFNPPDSISFVAKTVTARVRFVDTLTPVVDSTLITTNYLLTHTQDGFLLTGKQVSTDYLRNGQLVENDISRLSSNIEVTTELSKNGIAKAVRGYETLFARIDSIPDKKTIEALKQVFSPSALAAKDVNEWNGKMSHVIDKALKLGIDKHDTTSMSVGDGSTLRFYSVSEFADTIRMDGKLTLRLVIASDTDPLELARNLNMSAAAVGKLFNLPDSMLSVSKSSVSGYHSLTEMLVDVETLLVQRESQHRVVIAPVQTKDGRTVVSQMSETLEKVFEFDR